MSAVFAKNNTAVITGGASGIGLALAKKCVGYGMRVLVVDLNEANLEAVKKDLGAGVSTLKMNVGNADEWEGLTEVVTKEFGGQINLLALNAGTTGQTSFTDPSTSPTFSKILQTNLFGVINGLTTLVPIIKSYSTSPASPSAIVITGSKQGITNPPGNPAYNASKAAVKTLAEHLSYDLRDVKSISVHLLVPGWTWTGIAGNSGPDPKPKPDAAWWPEQVADYLEEKMNEGQFWVLCPDNDVTTDMDKKRMLWNADDAVLGRPPLSRWREEFGGEFKAWMEKK
ncbi:hypothetical protein F5Y16DRAFT_258611 [Xylariaceae sp. FL0255]|nr:hypothetical protein F5Y16DRAFT_258611 [Xylariaceae sp. FL0255]